MRYATCLAALVLFSGTIGCASRHEQGVKSNYRQQWTSVAADTKTTTEAARAVLEERELNDISANSTAVDGVASGKQADGKKVNVDIQKTNAGSQVSVTVGTLGDPRLGAELASEIKARAERDE